MKTAIHLPLSGRFLAKFLLVGLLALPGRMAVAASSSTTVVTFDANGGTGTMKKQTFRSGVSQRLRANAFKRTGGVFVGWAKSRNGAIAYKNRQMVKNIKAGGGKLTLYARWAKSTYKVRFKPNGGTGTMKVESFQYGKAKALFKNRFTRKGYVFAGWSDRPKGKVKFSDGKKVKNLTKTGYTIYLYAVWANTYKVQFNANGGRGSMAVQSLKYGKAYALRVNAFTRAGYTFAGWAKSAGGSAVYRNGANVRDLAKNGATITLYAVWRANMYKVRFNANGGRGTMADQSFTYNAAQSLRANAFARTGYTFAGWAKSASGSKVYGNRQSVSNLATANGAVVTLYAVWTSNTTPPAPAANGLIVRYYDISTSGYSTWIQSEAAMTNYFASRTPTIVTNTLDWGETLQSGFQEDNLTDYFQDYPGLWLDHAPTNRYHGKYANKSQERFAMLFKGEFVTSEAGTYGFAMSCDDSMVLYIDGMRICSFQWPTRTWQPYSATSSASLLPGRHRILLATYESTGSQGMFLSWKQPGETVWSPLPQDVLFQKWSPAPPSGLLVRYYDISSSGCSTWTQSEAAMTNYFASRTPTIVTNTLDWGKTLQSGFQQNNTGTYFSNYPGLWLNQVSTNRYHGKYAKQSQDNFAMLFEGFLQTDVAGTYSFAAACDDAIVLYIDGTRIVACTEWRQVPQPVSISLETGIHRITIATYEKGGSAGMWVEWKKPGDSSYSPVPQNVLSRTAAGGNTLLDGLVAWYSFDGNANDSSGNGNHGTVNGATLCADRNDKAKSAYSFDGNDTITVADNDSFDSVTNAFTIACWVRIDSLDNDQAPIVSKAYSGNRHFALELNYRNSEDAFIGGYKNQAHFTQRPTIGRWTHVVVTLDSGLMSRSYVNGQLVGTFQCETRLSPNNDPLRIGCDPCGKTEYLRGALDDLAIWRRALTAEEVARLYTGITPWTGQDQMTYCIIDLSAGSSASSYPVSYLSEPPAGGFNTGEYKTTKLVLKRIEAGSFKMGGSVNVTLTKPFFIGLFEVTQKQYQLVTGSNPSYFSGDMRPVEEVSYNAIRGSSLGAQWPSSNAVDSSSFLGKLRARTGLDFDLPTEAQWEYACRAGTATTFSYGDSADGNYMWYSSNSSSQTHEVGTKLPNTWGLYDMHGNVQEWCLDWNASSLSGGTDPKGSSSGSTREERGGGWTLDAQYCTSSSRDAVSPSNGRNDDGFRLVRTLSE